MRPAAAVLIVFALTVCQGQKKEENLGDQAAKIVSDTNVLREANDAANSVIREATDCEAVKAVLPEANRRLDEVAGKIWTATGRTTFEALRKQVATIAQNCP